MKTLKQIKEEYDNNFLSQVEIPEEISLEESSRYKDRPASHSIPTPSQMPIVLVFRRITYRTYPDKQVVALYYSKLVDKYLSIPFGPTGNLNMSEAIAHDTLEEGPVWDAVKGGVKGGIRGAGKGAMLGTVAHAPGMVAGGVVGGAVGAYKGAKKAYNKSKDTNVNEHFKMNLENLRNEEKDDDPYGVKTAISMVPFASAYQKYKEGDKAGALKSGAVDAALLGVGAGALKSLKTATAGKGIIGGAKEVVKRVVKAPVKIASKALDLGTKAAAVSALTGGTTEKSTTDRSSGALLRNKPGAKTYSSWEKKSSSNPIQQSRLDTAAAKEAQSSLSKRQANENKMSDIRKMVNEGIENKDILINGRSVTLNTSMAKRILEVYDSVNTKNKKIVEGMLNEDLESFKKLLNFSIRN